MSAGEIREKRTKKMRMLVHQSIENAVAKGQEEVLVSVDWISLAIKVELNKAGYQVEDQNDFYFLISWHE